MSHIERFRPLIEGEGGYIHHDLRLLVGDEAEHGLVSLAGVPNDKLALRIPRSLGEQDPIKCPGPWTKFLLEIGVELTQLVLNRRVFTEGVLPVLDAANHSYDGGRLVELEDCYELYGTTFVYTEDREYLKLYWDIDA